MKEKLEKILKEANISEAAARQVSEGICEAFDSWTKKQTEIKSLEDKETFNLVKENLDKVKDVHQKEIEGMKKQLNEAKEDFQKRLNAAREGVKKLIEEDYKIHKQELAQKVKLFVESKWQEAEQVIREQVEKEIKEDAVSTKVNQLSESISKFLNTDSTTPKTIIKENTEEIVKLKKQIDALSKDKSALIKENTTLKSENKLLQEKVSKPNKPLIEKVNESKIGKILEQKQVEAQTDEAQNQFINEIVHLATYNRK